MEDYCDRCEKIIASSERFEKRLDQHDSLIREISMKLNLILGGIVLSPFIIAAITLLMKTK